jgi:hypothetical protein
MVKKIADGKYKCCGKIMSQHDTTISHTGYTCLKCGKRVQTIGGWGKEMVDEKGFTEEGYTNPIAFVPVVA